MVIDGFSKTAITMHLLIFTVFIRTRTETAQKISWGSRQTDMPCISRDESSNAPTITIRGPGKEWAQLGLTEAWREREADCGAIEGVWQTTIIIDALDECNPRTRGSLFSALKRIVSVASNIKIFVTARNDGDIDEKLREFSNHYIHAVDNTGDINRFIDTEIERRCRPDDLKDGEMSLLDGTASPDLKERIISTLKKKACGVWVDPLAW